MCVEPQILKPGVMREDVSTCVRVRVRVRVRVCIKHVFTSDCVCVCLCVIKNVSTSNSQLMSAPKLEPKPSQDVSRTPKLILHKHKP